jgi:hypothetical protein
MLSFEHHSVLANDLLEVNSGCGSISNVKETGVDVDQLNNYQ